MILSRLTADAKKNVRAAYDLSDRTLDFEQLILADLSGPGILVPLISSTDHLAKILRGKIASLAVDGGETERVRRLFGELQRFDAPPSMELEPILGKIGDGEIEWQHILAAIVAMPGNLLPLLQQDCKLTWHDILRAAVSEHSHSEAPVAGGSDAVSGFTTDLIDLAPSFSDLVGRENEINQLMAILLRKRANNPVLIGEAGVGKTQIVEGLAVRVANGDVPARLRGKRIRSVDVSSLVSGTKFRGEFEERISAFVKYAKEASGNTIFFIDEIHNLMGLGSASGGMDAANLLKPALSRGELWCIGATTFAEFNKLEKDPAVRRRFQPIVVEEQSESEVLEILEKVASSYESHHQVKFPRETQVAIVRLARRYIGDIRSPARELGLLDEVGAHFSLEDRNGHCVEPDDVARIVSVRTGIPEHRLQGDMLERIVNLKQRLKAQVFGQDQVIDHVDNQCRVSFAGLSDPQRPRSLLFFAGPSGVGKTELAKAMARELYGSEDALIRLDMSEFSESSARSRLVGADPGLVGYEEGGRLTEAVRRKPFSLILLDEFEKAHPNVWRLFLQVFGDGRLTDGKGRTVNFRESIIVMTSNVGSELLYILRDITDKNDSEVALNERLSSVNNLTPATESVVREEAVAVRDHRAPDVARIVRTSLLTLPGFPPELFSRIGTPIVFRYLDNDALIQILARTSRELVRNVLRSRNKDEQQTVVSECGLTAGIAIEASGFSLNLSAATVRYLVEDVGNDPIVGGRAIVNEFQRTITPAIASEIIGNPQVATITVDSGGVSSTHGST